MHGVVLCVLALAASVDGHVRHASDPESLDDVRFRALSDEAGVKGYPGHIAPNMVAHQML